MTKCVPFRLEIPIRPSRPHEYGHVINRISVYPDSCGRGLKQFWRAVLKQRGFGEGIQWFRVDRRSICVTTICVEEA